MRNLFFVIIFLICVSGFIKAETQYSTIQIDKIVSEDFDLFEDKAETEQVAVSELKTEKKEKIKNPWLRIFLGILFLAILYRIVLLLSRR